MNIFGKEGDIKAEKILTELEAADESEINPVEEEAEEIKPDSDSDLAKQLELYKEQLLRRAAEFENYKRRTENEISNITKFANEYLISDLLPVVDALERSLVAGKENSDYDSFYKGIELIYSKLMKIFEQKGLKPVEALNQPFDVNFHEAMMAMPKDDVKPNTVIQEMEKGYLLLDKVIRHSKVIVSAENNGG
jgi:molecular chaperone GrpE